MGPSGLPNNTAPCLSSVIFSSLKPVGQSTCNQNRSKLWSGRQPGERKCVHFMLQTKRGKSDWNKYPDAVSLPEGCRADVMTIQSPKLPGCALCVVWSIKVTKEGGITPKLEVLPRLPERALHMDQKKVMEKAPRSFQSLLRVLGAEAAIDSLIRAVCVD